MSESKNNCQELSTQKNNAYGKIHIFPGLKVGGDFWK